MATTCDGEVGGARRYRGDSHQFAKPPSTPSVKTADATERRDVGCRREEHLGSAQIAL